MPDTFRSFTLSLKNAFELTHKLTKATSSPSLPLVVNLCTYFAWYVAQSGVDVRVSNTHSMFDMNGVNWIIPENENSGKGLLFCLLSIWIFDSVSNYIIFFILYLIELICITIRSSINFISFMLLWHVM